MQLDIAAAGLFVGLIIGLTGMGGGALMTPILVIFFGVTPSAAISSDVVASFILKPIGGSVHARRGTVNWTLVRWLAIGSVPSAFAGAWIISNLGGAGRRGPHQADPRHRPAHRGGRDDGEDLDPDAGGPQVDEARSPIAIQPVPTLDHRRRRRRDGRHDLGRVGVADDRRVDAALPDDVVEAARRHRPRPGRPARRRRRAGSPHLREPLAWT